MNLSDWIIVIVLAAAAILAAFPVHRQKKKSKCTGNCLYCSAECHSNHAQTKED